MATLQQQQFPQAFGGSGGMPQFGQSSMPGFGGGNPFMMQRPQFGGFPQPQPGSGPGMRPAVMPQQGGGFPFGQQPQQGGRRQAPGQQMPAFNMPQPQQMPNIPGMPPQSGPGGQWQTPGGQSPADARRQQGMQQPPGGQRHQMMNPFMMGSQQFAGGIQQPIYQMPQQPQGQPFNNPFGGGPTAFTPNLPPERQPQQPRRTADDVRRAMFSY